MRIRDLPRRLLARPAWGCAAIAALLRTLLVLDAWATNPFVKGPVLDAAYYLRWAREIAAGDFLGRAGLSPPGLVNGEPWLLNPLYAYVLASFVGAAGSSHLPILVAQALLGAATVGLAAAAATRTFGRVAGWIAGLLVAFSTPLAEMDQHVAVASLATFLIAGACFACAPAAPTDRKGAHGPAAAALWLGVGALARPVTVLAIPFVAWRFAREATTASQRLRTLALAAAVFGACAVPSLWRNWAVSGDPALYTSAGGINAFMGNNPDARKYRQMVSNLIHFHPIEMHHDATRLVAADVGHEPTRGEVSSWFWARTLEDVRENPGASAAHALHKARWFFGPVEIPSSASLSIDLWFSPKLAFAFVPTWLIACLGAAGLWAHRRRRDVLFGPGAIVAAHVAILTLVFPLSHYRAPAIPALAVLAAGAVTAAFDRRLGAARWVVAAVAAAFAAAGALPPQPDLLTTRDEIQLGAHAMQAGRLAEAEDHARRAIASFPQVDPGGSGSPLAFQLLADVLTRQGRRDEALAEVNKAIDVAPDEAIPRLMRASMFEVLGNLRAAEADARHVTETHPANADGWYWLGRVLSRDPARRDEAQRCLRECIRRGGRPDAATLRRAGLPVPGQE